jgi:hypothetical protein
MVEVPRIHRTRKWICGVSIPIIRDIVVIDDMDPWKILGDSGPIGRVIDGTIFASVVLNIEPKSKRYIDIDEVAKEDHERWPKSWNPLGEMPKTRDRERM